MRSKQGFSLIEVVIAVIVVGFGITLYMKMQSMSREQTRQNQYIMEAGRLIEKNIADLRINIASDTVNNWPPSPLDVTEAPVNGITVRRILSMAKSPIDGADIPQVYKDSIIASWGSGPLDTLKVTTYVAKSF